jgi:hypothetical protein
MIVKEVECSRGIFSKSRKLDRDRGYQKIRSPSNRKLNKSRNREIEKKKERLVKDSIEMHVGVVYRKKSAL